MKPVKRGLVEAQQAAAASAQDRLQPGRTFLERAVLVAVEFTGERRKLTAAARMARKAAAVSVGAPEPHRSEADQPQTNTTHIADLDFEASLAEFHFL